MTMENLPVEVLSDIVIRLLAKQLAQMRCACKPWNALLSDSFFIKSHLHRSIHNNNDILLFFSHALPECSLVKACRASSPDLELTKFIKVPVDSQFQIGYGRIIGSVNGLICFYYTSYDDDSLPEYVVYIWNPALSAVLTLPPSSLPCNNKIEKHFRFGYDPKTDDYRVVKLTSLISPPVMLPEVEVYSMRKGSWELITQKLPYHISMITDYDRFCVDGHDGRIHWIAHCLDRCPRRRIVSFDLGAETFSEIPLPDSLLHNHASRICCLGVLGGKLCVMSTVTNASRICCLDAETFSEIPLPDSLLHNHASRICCLGVLGGKLCVMSTVTNGECGVWVMDEYGVADSWVKHPVFSPFNDTFPSGFTSHNELIFEFDFRIYLYDPVAAKTTRFKVMSRRTSELKIVEYVDSLVWVASDKNELSKKNLLISILKSHELLTKGLQKATKGISRFLFRRGI